MRMRSRIRKALPLLICLCLCGLIAAAAAEGSLRTADGFEYEDYDGYAMPVAYRGEYLPRSLPDHLNDSAVFMEYTDDIFSDLVRESGVYRYGLVAEDEAYIVGYTGYERVAVIPSEIDGVPVTGIGDRAFWLSGCERDSFAEVVIVPDSVRVIGEQAFSCTGIGYIVLGEGLEEIGDLAFQGHSQMPLRIPAGVRKMGINPFADHVDLGLVNGFLFPAMESGEHFGVDFDAGQILWGREDMRLITFRGYLSDEWRPSSTVTVPDGIRVIGSYSFYEAVGVSEVILPDTVEVIEPWAFFMSMDLERITIPDSVREIGEGAFAETAIRELEIPSGVTTIGAGILDRWDGSVPTIVCDPGSAAEAYAREHGWQIRFR